MTLRALSPLRHRDFRLLWFGQLVSVFGNSLYGVALPFQLLALGASPLQLGTVVSLSVFANVGFLLIGGALADRLPRRLLLLASDLAGALTVGLVAILSATGLLRIEHMYGAAVVLGAANALLDPAYTALVPDIVPPEALPAGSAARRVGRSIARITGPIAGGLLVSFASPAAAFGLDALTFVLSVATLLMLRVPNRSPATRQSLVREVGGGLRYVWSVSWLWPTTLYFMLVNIAYAGQYTVTMPLLVRDRLAGDASLYGVITAAMGVGGIIAALVLGGLRVHRPGRLLFSLELTSSVLFVLVGLLPIAPVVVLLVALNNACLAGSTIVWEALLQRHVPGAFIGRVASIDTFGNALINPLGPLVAATLVGLVGPASTLVISGTYATVLAAIGFMVAPVRHIADDRHDAIP